MKENNFSEQRKERARQILEKSEPQMISENAFLVPSQTSDRKYRVTFNDTFSCDCMDFQERCKGQGRFCKHIQAIILYNSLRRVINQQEEVFILNSEQNKPVCPSCSSHDLIKRGIRKTKLKQVQRYGCKDCNARFTLDPIKHIKVNYKFVTLAMDSYYKGLSYRDIADQFKQFYGIELHHETIRRWVLRFSKILSDYSKTIKPEIKGVWNADETLILTKKGEKKEIQKNYNYVWNVIDNKSKFLLASVDSGRSRNSKDAQRVFTEAYKQNGKIPYQIIVDGFQGYENGCRKTFKNWNNKRKVKFTSIKGRRKEVNNNVIEGHHSGQKEFHKVRRGVNEVQTYQDGFRVFHNFIRKTVKDKTTPAEKCNLVIPTQNRWIGMLNENIQKINPIEVKEEIPSLRIKN